MNDNDGDSTARMPAGLGAPLAKLSMPRLARGVVRPRLHGLLDDARQKAAVWIVAPGGAGKTTLAATYIAERELPFIWYQVDQDDADPATFFYYLGMAAKKVGTDREIFLPLLTPEYLHDIPGFARRYFRDFFAVVPAGTVLVLDNYQQLAGAGLLSELLRCAIGEMPAGNNMMVISRADPPPELARLRVIGALESIGWDDFQLRLDETEAIVSLSLKLEPAVIRRLHERSEGWAAGLILLIEQIKRKKDIDQVIGAVSPQSIFDFFASEFFDQLPESTRDFLLRTALLAHVTRRWRRR